MEGWSESKGHVIKKKNEPLPKERDLRYSIPFILGQYTEARTRQQEANSKTRGPQRVLKFDRRAGQERTECFGEQPRERERDVAWDIWKTCFNVTWT